MRAMVIPRYGPSDVFEMADLEPLSCGPKDLRIEIHAASVNPVDVKQRAGGQRGVAHFRLPWVLGLDAAGVVTEVGAQVTGFEVGDAVFTSPTHRRRGCFAEEVVVDHRAVARKPASLSFEEAASVPLVALTAWDALVTKGKLKPGQRLLVQAGAGGVGTVTIQLAKHLGGHVLTTCSEGNTELVTSLGADEVIDYRKTPFETAARDLDLVVDTLGGEGREKCLPLMKRGGHIAGLVSGLPGATKRYGPYLGVLWVAWDLLRFKVKARVRGVSTSSVLRPCDGEILGRLGALYDEGVLKPVVDRVFPLEELAEAHAYSETGRARGKIVIRVKG